MLNKFIYTFGPLCIICFFLVSILYLSGSRVDFASIPDIRPRVLSLFTDVPEGFVKVVDTADGDTIIVSQNGNEETVRLLGIDTPETKDPKRPVQCFGKQASDYTKSMVAGNAVRLVADPTGDDTDKYNRLLRYVYLEDGSLLNERLVYFGYAFVYDEFPTSKTPVLKRMEEDAKKHNRGLWSACTVTEKKSGKGHTTNAVSTHSQ